MPSYTPERKTEAIARIDEHLRVVGCKEWLALFAEFDDVPETTMWQWIRLRKGIAEAIGQVTEPSVLRETSDHGLRDVVQMSTKPLPPGSRVTVLTPDKSRSIDISLEIPRMFADASKLRDYAVRTRTNADGESEEYIKNPVIFEKSITRRINLIDTMLKVTKEAWDIRSAQAFYRIVLEEVGREAPEVQRRIMGRLAELSASRGGGMGLRV